MFGDLRIALFAFAFGAGLSSVEHHWGTSRATLGWACTALGLFCLVLTLAWRHRLRREALARIDTTLAKVEASMSSASVPRGPRIQGEHWPPAPPPTPKPEARR